MTESKLSRRDSLRSFVMVGVAGAAAAAGATALVSPADAAGQPHMSRALANLQAALNQLDAAQPDKGGHRVKAMALVREAISETTKGMAFAAM